MERDAYSLAFVFKNEYVLYEIMSRQLQKAILPDLNELIDPFDRFGGERRVVGRRIKQHLTDAATGFDLIDTVRRDRGLRRIFAQTWKSILECDQIVIRLRNLGRMMARF